MRKSLGLAFKGLYKVNSKRASFKSINQEAWKDSLIPNFDPTDDLENPNRWRLTILSIICVTLFFIMFLKLFNLQIARGEENRKLADGNRIQVKVIHAPRGIIFDRNGKALTVNSPGFRLKNEEDISYISRDEALAMEAKDDPGLKDLEVDNIREYPFSDKTAHILGYVSEINEEELKKLSSYKIGDKIGRGGIEESYEEVLKGFDGGEITEVDASGKDLRVLGRKEPIPGKNLYLTMDLSLQEITSKFLEEAVKKSGSCCGAAVVSDPKTGEILSLVSYPSFNPANVEDFLNAKNSPMLNRVTGGTYPPGSTFKIASALAGLSTGKISKTTAFEDTGEISLGPYKFSNWYFNQYGKVEGSVDLVKALKRSNDTYFYFLAQATGEKVLGDIAKKIGMGRILGIDIPGENPGLIPDSKWKEENIEEVWYPGDTLHMSIGQGFVLSTPLQVLNLASIVASDGQMFIPHMLLKISDQEKIIKEIEPKSEKLGFKFDDLELIRKGMEEAASSGGTAWPFFIFPIQTAGKTGTAEFEDPKNKTHAWYTGYAPAGDPKIAAVVLIEGGGEGSSIASPVVKEIFRWFLSEDKNNLIRDIGGVATESARSLGE